MQALSQGTLLSLPKKKVVVELDERDYPFDLIVPDEVSSVENTLPGIRPPLDEEITLVNLVDFDDAPTLTDIQVQAPYWLDKPKPIQSSPKGCK